MYMVGQDKKVAENLGGDAEFTAKVKKLFAGTMQEARRFMEPIEEDKACSETSDENA